jgi:histidinol-phosphatase (PHP family)
MHTHTLLDDGNDDAETMCRAAYEKKLYAIGFSAHAPITKKTGIESDWNLKDDLVDEYVDKVLSAKNRWKGKLEVFLGFEIDYIKGLRSAIDSDIKSINPDYLIGSVHYVIPENGAQPFTVDGSIEEFEKGVKEGFNGDVQALMHYYYNAVTEMIALGGFEILGHADLIKKNCQDKNLWSKESEACRQREMARAAAEAGLTVEVNTGGINRRKIRDVYPSLSFLRLFNENNVPAIITADAHRAADIDGNYETAIQTLSNAGYKKHVISFQKLKENYIFQTENIVII